MLYTITIARACSQLFASEVEIALIQQRFKDMMEVILLSYNDTDIENNNHDNNNKRHVPLQLPKFDQQEENSDIDRLFAVH